MRKTQRELARLVAAEKIVSPAFVPSFSLLAVGTDKALRFVATVAIGANVFEAAADNGKIRTFSDVDGFLKYAAKVAEAGDGVYHVNVDTGSLLASTVPSNMAQWAQNQVTALGKKRVAQLAVVAGLDDELSFMVGWESGNMAQKEKKGEVEQQKVAVQTDIAAIDAEIVRMNALLP